MQYNHIETYTYTRSELIQNAQIITFEPQKENKKSFIQNVNANLYENINNYAGNIIYINNYTELNNNKFNTSTGTINTNNGKLVFNLSYEILSDSTPFLDSGRILETKATYKSGIYDTKLGNDVLITIQSLSDFNQTRILTIQY
jgi:hypothetical protein